MGGTLTFPVDDDLKRIVEHARKNGKRRIPCSGEHGESPGLYLVKDHGVYLMPASDKPLLKEDGKSRLVAYARECDPRSLGFDEWWRNAGDICGGDDFAELLGLGTFEGAIARGARKVTIKVSRTTLLIRCQGRRVPVGES